jgi:large subunit ribosomal protein L3
LEAPPIVICAVKVYTRDINGLRTLAEAWVKEPPAVLGRVFTLPEGFKTDEALKKIEGNMLKIVKVRAVAITQPKDASLPKKKPDIAEIEIGGGTIQQQLDYARSLLGKTITAAEIFKEGQFVDIASVSPYFRLREGRRREALQLSVRGTHTILCTALPVQDRWVSIREQSITSAFSR